MILLDDLTGSASSIQQDAELYDIQKFRKNMTDSKFNQYTFTDKLKILISGSENTQNYFIVETSV